MNRVDGTPMLHIKRIEIAALSLRENYRFKVNGVTIALAAYSAAHLRIVCEAPHRHATVIPPVIEGVEIDDIYGENPGWKERIYRLSGPPINEVIAFVANANTKQEIAECLILWASYITQNSQVTVP